MLKIDLHLHCKGDPKDTWIKYTSKELIDKAKEIGLDVIAITPHEKVFDDAEAIAYAKKQNILLIPGIEKNISKKHTIILNPDKQIEKIHTLKELKEYKKKHPEILIIAAHPFYGTKASHNYNITRNLKLFDAWEFSYFYTNKINPNKRLKRIARLYKKPIIGNSDTHILKNLGRTYSKVPAMKDTRNIFDSIRAGRIEIKTTPLTNKEFLKSAIKMIFRIKSK